MEILFLTIFLSTLLSALFLFLFYRNRNNTAIRSPEQESLRPFAAEIPVKSIRK